MMNELPMPDKQETSNLPAKDSKQVFRKSNAYTLVLEFYSVTLKINLSLN